MKKIETNGRYLMHGDKPFFWLGDTAWLLFQKTDEDEAAATVRSAPGKRPCTMRVRGR
ncbi:MAG: DUF4038 domain-containing protein [Firmicutes bacterium]|nr:DUF4038 domain-containing protein [Bacillota bacterium]